MAVLLHKRQGGFSLIEVCITLVVLAVMLRIAMPGYGVWIGNQNIRAAAESIIGAVNLARMEAMKRNGRVLFQLTDGGDNASAWTVCPVARGALVCDPAQAAIQTRDGGEESGAVVIAVSANAASTAAGAFATPLAAGGLPGGILFNGLGRPSTAAGALNLVRIDVRNPNLPPDSERRLVIAVDAGGSARACDPQLPATNPRAC